MDINTATKAEMLAFYNEHCHLIGKQPRKQLKDKEEGIKLYSQISKAMEDSVAPEPPPVVEETVNLDEVVVPEKGEEPKLPKAQRAGKGRKVSVSARCRELIMAGMDNSSIWDLIKVEFGLDDSKKSYPSWNRADMKRHMPSARKGFENHYEVRKLIISGLNNDEIADRINDKKFDASGVQLVRKAMLDGTVED